MYKHTDVHDIQHQYFRKPQTLTRKEAFKLFLWNPKTQECFGRTGSSWGKRSKILAQQQVDRIHKSALVLCRMPDFRQR
jgi:Sodium / potassium ATPase beta chain